MPYKLFKSHHDNFPKWIDNATRILIIKKKLAHKKYKNSKLTSDYEEFSLLRSQCKSALDECKKRYLSKIENNIVNDTNAFWKYVKSKTDLSSLPANMFLKNAWGNCPKTIADLFATHFESVYCHENSSNFKWACNQNCPNPVDLNVITIEIENILIKIGALKSSTKRSPDGIPSIFVKKCAESLSLPLHILFNNSLFLSKVPSVWRISYITPIHKTGSRSDVENYRPVSIGSPIAKVFESCVTDIISFAVKNIIFNNQHGFCKGRSTATNLFVFTNYVIESMELGYSIDCVYTDMSKAFDRINVNLLIAKLAWLGFDDPLLSWLKSYLSNRKQFVLINGIKSRCIDAVSGVPQGSHLGPVLFSLFVNDIVNVIHSSEILLFADDVKIFKCIGSLNDCLALQADLYNFEMWCECNKLELNIPKCKLITFNRKHCSINYQYSLSNTYLKKFLYVPI